jgi:hypothetical protein
VEREFVYVVLTDSGEQVTLTPEEFAKKYAWKNDPSKVQSTTGTKADDGTKKPEKQTDSPKSQQAGPAKQTHESGKRGRNKP